MWRTRVYRTVEWSVTWIMRKRLLNISTWHPGTLLSDTRQLDDHISPLYMDTTASACPSKAGRFRLLSLPTSIRPLLCPFLYQLLISFGSSWLISSPVHFSSTEARCICSFLKRQLISTELLAWLLIAVYLLIHLASRGCTWAGNILYISTSGFWQKHFSKGLRALASSCLSRVFLFPGLFLSLNTFWTSNGTCHRHM